MGFDWIYLNPIQYAGFSGSIYAIKDYYRLNPLVRGDAASFDAELIAGFVRDANGHGVDVMMDLVVNHTSRDAALVALHPDWYVRDADGEIRSPSIADLVDPSRVTVWGDLAEIDWSERPERAAIVAYFAGVVRHYARLGVRGFRCDAAYKVPAAVWLDLRAAAESTSENATFAAETLGCTSEQIEALADARFDYLFDSSKWWDFRADWLLAQYERLRRIAPSIAFPESHDTPRLAAELADLPHARIEAEYRLRYLFAAFFSGGVLMPIGYEYGFSRRLDVVRSRAEDWEVPAFDLTPYVAAVNAMKAALPALSGAGPQRRVTAANQALVGLLRDGVDEADYALALINPDLDAAASIRSDDVLRMLEGRARPSDDTPLTEPLDVAPGGTLVLRPREMRVFGPVRGRRAAKAPHAP